MLMTNTHQNIPLNILLADDDADDRYFFERALQDLPITTNLKTVPDGARLMEYLYKNTDHLPDVLFLDNNMPRKNGSECLAEIKNNAQLKGIPIVMCSTSLGNDFHCFAQRGECRGCLRKLARHRLDRRQPHRYNL